MESFNSSMRDMLARLNRRTKRFSKSIDSLEDIELLEIDELCTYIKKDLKTEDSTPSYGLLLIDGQVKLLTLK